MSDRRKLIILVLLGLTVVLAALGMFISNNIRVNDSAAENTTDFSNCDTETGICTVPTDTICNTIKVYVHQCNDIKANGVDCVNIKESNFKDSFVSGQEIDITDYIQNSCGTVQMYLESGSSSATSVGACGSIKRTFSTNCTTGAPVSTPLSGPVITPPIEEPQDNDDNEEEPPIVDEEPEEPLEEPEITNSVSVITQSASTCSTGGDATLNITITVTNIGNQTAVLNSITETLDSRLATNSITAGSFVPSASSTSSTQAVWNGPINIAVNESKTYKYSIIIPQNKLATFVEGVSSQSLVSYNNARQNGNSASFTLKSMFNCTVPTTGLPNTGILDDLRFFVIGIMFITLGYFIYKRDLGLNYSLSFLNGMAAFRRSTKTKISKSVLNAAPFEEGIEERIKEKFKKRT